MVQLLKLAFLVAFGLQAAEFDPGNSFYTVSCHQPGVGIPVTVDIRLRDRHGDAADAQNVTVKTDEMKIQASVKKLGVGHFQGTVTFPNPGCAVNLLITADGKKVLENILPDGGKLDYCSQYLREINRSEMKKTAESLQIISLCRAVDSYWVLGELRGKELLKDRVYRISAPIVFSGVSGKGISFNCGQRNADGGWAGHTQYGKFITGSGKTEMTADFHPYQTAATMSFAEVLLHAEGKVEFSFPRVEVKPTFISQPYPGVRVTMNASPGVVRTAPSYASAAAAGFEELLNQPENHDLKTQLASPVQGEEAWNIRQELSRRNQINKQRENDEIRKSLCSESLKYGPGIRAMTAQKLQTPRKIDGDLSKWNHFSSGFSAIRPKRGPAALGSKVAACYDADNLYFAFHFEGAPKEPGSPGSKDAPSIWRNDRIEIFIAEPSGTGYRQFAIGAGGQLYDGADGDGMVNFDWKAVARCDSHGWNVEVEIPWRSLGRKKPDPELMVNFCRTVPQSEESCWSLKNKGFHERDSMGFLVMDSFGKATDAAGYIAEKNREFAAGEQKNAKATDQARKNLKGRNTLILSNWEEKYDFEKDPGFQVRFLSERLKSGKTPSLHFRQAINEFAHRSFIVSAMSPTGEISFVASDLKSTDGKLIPAGKLQVDQIRYLEPDRQLWPDYFDMWSKRPLPELVEKVEVPLTLGEFESAQLRLVIDSRGVAPGRYSGVLTVQNGNRKFQLPLECEVMNFALPPCESSPFCIYLFTALPYGGKSGEAWARLLKEHYVTEVSFEHPKVLVNGQVSNPPGWRDKDYIDRMSSWTPPAGAKIQIDGSAAVLDDRISICARYGLRPQFSNRTGSIYPALMPSLDSHLKKLGIPSGGYLYKLGDEDHSAWLLPLAKKIREYVPDIRLTMIPAGNGYWDLKVLSEAFNQLTYSRAAMTINAQGEQDLRQLGKQGVQLARYTNRTSWAERTAPLSGRFDIWDVIIREGLDGFQVWTAGICPQINYCFGYKGCARIPVHNFPPEKQTTCQLIYVRKQGDFYKPVSCIRLEDLRDGITDALYYREAERRLNAAGDVAGLAELKKIADSPKTDREDYNRARESMTKLIMRHP